VVGILSLLLLWPLRNLSENRWIKTFTKWFFRALIPLVAMLFLAILERIGCYGITVNRFLVLAMSIGLALLVLYFVFGRAKDIRIIPIVVCLTALFSAYGPFSAFAISKYSQKSRLESYLNKAGLLENNSLKMATSQIPYDERLEMSEIIRYLAEWHGLDSFSPWLSDSALNSIRSNVSEHQIPDSIAKAMGFVYVYNPFASRNNGIYFRAALKENNGVMIYGYNQLFNFINDDKQTFFIGDNQDTLYVWLENEQPDIKLLLAPQGLTGNIAFSDSIRAALADIHNDEINCDRLDLATDIGEYSFRFKVKQVSGRADSDSIKIYNMSTYILVRKNSP
jgi:hypothetical protein